jgi:hypothetical protein
LKLQTPIENGANKTGKVAQRGGGAEAERRRDGRNDRTPDRDKW